MPRSWSPDGISRTKEQALPRSPARTSGRGRPPTGDEALRETQNGGSASHGRLCSQQGLLAARAWLPGPNQAAVGYHPWMAGKGTTLRSPKPDLWGTGAGMGGSTPQAREEGLTSGQSLEPHGGLCWCLAVPGCSTSRWSWAGVGNLVLSWSLEEGGTSWRARWLSAWPA